MQLERHVLFWVVAALAAVLILNFLAPVLLPFVIGLTLAYFLNPVVDAIGRLGVPRWASAVLILALALLLIAAAAVFLLPVLAQQATSLAEAAPGELTRLRGLIETAARERLGERYPEAEASVRHWLDSVQNSLPEFAAGAAGMLWTQGSAAFSFLSVVLITPVVFFYALLDWPKLIRKVDSWLPRDNAPQIRALAAEIDDRVSAFIRGQGVVCIVLALFYAMALSAIGLRYGLLVGLLTGFASFIPFVGWALGTITATTLAVIQYWPEALQVLLVFSVFLAGQALDAGFLSPTIVGSKIGLHPVWMIFALLAFSYLFGFLGLLVAVPVSAAIGVLVRFGLRSYLASPVYQGREGAKV